MESYSSEHGHCCHNHCHHEGCCHHGHHHHGAHCHHAHEHHEDGKANYFLELADEAWQEVLKDKIKEHILKTQHDRMTKLAKIVSEGNNQRWKSRMEQKHSCKEFMEELCKFFSQAKK